MYSSEDLEHFRKTMSIASLLELCHSEKMYETFLFLVSDGGNAEGHLHRTVLFP